MTVSAVHVFSIKAPSRRQAIPSTLCLSQGNLGGVYTCNPPNYLNFVLYISSLRAGSLVGIVGEGAGEKNGARKSDPIG